MRADQWCECPTCRGSGEGGPSIITCPTCHGIGYDAGCCCPYCHGTGEVFPTREDCHGLGEVLVDTLLELLAPD